MQASTKVEQVMWIRAFAVLFELRARVILNFNSRTLETIYSNPSSPKKSEVSFKWSNRKEKELRNSNISLKSEIDKYTNNKIEENKRTLE